MFFSHSPFRPNKYFPQDPYFPPLPNLREGLVAFWPLEGNYDDVSGNSFHLTPYGDYTEFVNTPIGQAFKIEHTTLSSTSDGSYAYVNDLPTTHYGYDNSQAFTFVFWVVPYVFDYQTSISFQPTSFHVAYPLGSIGNQPDSYSGSFPAEKGDSSQYNTIGSFLFTFANPGFYYSTWDGEGRSVGPLCFLRTPDLQEWEPFWCSLGDYNQRNIAYYSSPYAMVVISYFDRLSHSGSDYTEYWDYGFRGVETYLYFHPPYYYMTKKLNPFYNLAFFTRGNSPSVDSKDYYSIGNWTRFYLGLYSQWDALFYLPYPIAVKHVGLWYRRLERHELDYLYYCQASRIPL